MRIKEEFRKSGYFWLPSAPDRRVPGTLIISDGGLIELEVVGLFDESIEGLNRALNGNDELKRVVGHVEKHGMVTLDDCFYKKKNIAFGGISKSTIHVNRAFIGVAYDNEEEVVFNQLIFSVEGIDEWIGLSGIKIEHEFEKRTASITYAPPEEISLILNNGMNLLITFAWTLPGFKHLKEAKITQKTYFEIFSETKCQLSEFISIAYKITTLLGFAIDDTVCIEEVTAKSNDITRYIGDKKTKPVPISVYYASLPYTDKEPKIDRYRMLFVFRQLGRDAGRIFNNWIDAYDVIEPALNLYFSSKTGAHKYLYGKFLSLAQGLESYHRRTSNEKIMGETVFHDLTEQLIEKCPEDHKEWLSARLRYGNEVSLSRRLKSIIGPFKHLLGASRERDKLIRTIVDTRNYLTHYDKELKGKAASGRELWVLCLKMEAIFQLHLLQILGFTKEEVQSVFDNSDSLQQKLKEI